MQRLVGIERACLIGHLVAMAFGLAGLLLVMPHPEFLTHVPAGQTLFRWSMAGGGVVYILLGAIAVSIYAYRTLGLRAWLTFLVCSVGLSLTSELLGTSTGFPFGHYSYLSGLGYKINGLVPFTIPLSWYYLGLSSYLLARAGLETDKPTSGFLTVARGAAAVFLGALLLTSWDFVLDPAMSQTAMPFWYWHQPGAFFGMPYQNFVGWLGTGAVFMTVAVLLWGRTVAKPQATQLNFPLTVYLGNFAFAMVMSLAFGFWIPVLLGILLGVIPAMLCWRQSYLLSEKSAATEASLKPPVRVGVSAN
ncbi:gamma-carotene 1'-hydroxylase CruF [Thermoleptolyngbya sp. M55_K2018_002]|uniref:gamma-carotene 1'-hydroxylase CruF n=1 Tax=Thermoleptolyngbya sp. M55_K2018_002 TaxID=2747808 RepID=UPI0019FAC82B|nr:carotenoid biosynthesis protein [Thermoleptolyngbya sp. M55_K2018_002]HIK39728.1 carotenoid biosynthesis protein [Thermoleptolyngbya sp. M55_K2018_002]